MELKNKYVARDKYDKTGFIEYSEQLESKKYYLENSKFKFELSANTTQFKVTDNVTNETWLSSQNEYTDNKFNSNNELFTIYYEKKLEAPKSISVLEESVAFDNYSIKIGDKKIDILYKVGGKRNIILEDLPRKVSAKRFNELIIEPFRIKSSK